MEKVGKVETLQEIIAEMGEPTESSTTMLSPTACCCESRSIP